MNRNTRVVVGLCGFSCSVAWALGSQSMHCAAIREGTETAVETPSDLPVGAVNPSVAVESPYGPLNEELFVAQLEAMGEIQDPVPPEALAPLAPEVYKLFAAMLASLEEGASAGVPSALFPSSAGEQASRPLQSFETDRGLVYVVDWGHGVVHFLAFVPDQPGDWLKNLDDLALHLAITREGLEVRQVDPERLAQFVGAGERSAASRGIASAQERQAPEHGEDLLNAQLGLLSEAGSISPESLKESAPAVYELLREPMIEPLMAGAQTSELRPAAPAAPRPEGVQTKSTPTLGTLWTNRGVLSIVDGGDGVLRLVAFALDPHDPTLANAGPAFQAVITDQDVEVVDMDTSRLAQFVGWREGHELAELSDDTGGGSRALPDLPPEDEGAGGETTNVALDCNWTSNRVCCVVATETKICVACGTLAPITADMVCLNLK